MKIFITLLLVIVTVSFAQAQQVNRIKIEESGYSLQKFSNQMKVGLGLELTGVTVSTLFYLTSDVPTKSDINTVRAITTVAVVSGLLVQMSAVNHVRIAGTKLEVADSGIGIKYRF